MVRCTLQLLKISKGGTDRCSYNPIIKPKYNTKGGIKRFNFKQTHTNQAYIQSLIGRIIYDKDTRTHFIKEVWSDLLY